MWIPATAGERYRPCTLFGEEDQDAVIPVVIPVRILVASSRSEF